MVLETKPVQSDDEVSLAGDSLQPKLRTATRNGTVSEEGPPRDRSSQSDTSSTPPEPIIDPEFRDLLDGGHTLSETELEELIVATGGPTDALVVWESTNILVDGHRRLSICQRLGLPYKVRYEEFGSRDEAIAWIWKNQLARRNLPPEVRDKMIRKAVKSKVEAGASVGEAMEKVAGEADVSVRTVERAASREVMLDKVIVPIREKIERGDIEVTPAELKRLSKASIGKQREMAKLHEAGTRIADQPTRRGTQKKEPIDTVSIGSLEKGDSQSQKDGGTLATVASAPTPAPTQSFKGGGVWSPPSNAPSEKELLRPVRDHVKRLMAGLVEARKALHTLCEVNAIAIEDRDMNMNRLNAVCADIAPWIEKYVK